MKGGISRDDAAAALLLAAGEHGKASCSGEAAGCGDIAKRGSDVAVVTSGADQRESGDGSGPMCCGGTAGAVSSLRRQRKALLPSRYTGRNRLAAGCPFQLPDAVHTCAMIAARALGGENICLENPLLYLVYKTLYDR